MLNINLRKLRRSFRNVIKRFLYLKAFYNMLASEWTHSLNQFEVPWLSGRASDSGARDPGFEHHDRHSKLSKVLVNTQEAVALSAQHE